MAKRTKKSERELQIVAKTRQEGFQIVENIEQEFRHDLSVHLYSAFLIRLKSLGAFPPRLWTAWPLPLDLLVDPKLSKAYVDEDDVVPIENIPKAKKPTGGKQNRAKKAAQRRKEQEEIDLAVESLDSLNYMNGEFQDDNNLGRETVFLDQEQEEILSDPDKILECEINSLYQSIIVKKIQK